MKYTQEEAEKKVRNICFGIDKAQKEIRLGQQDLAKWEKEAQLFCPHAIGDVVVGNSHQKVKGKQYEMTVEGIEILYRESDPGNGNWGAYWHFSGKRLTMQGRVSTLTDHLVIPFQEAVHVRRD